MFGFKKLFRKKGLSIKNVLFMEDVSEVGSILFGYFIVKDKDLLKFYKVVWIGDLVKVKQIVKKGDINQFDRENRQFIRLISFIYNW